MSENLISNFANHLEESGRSKSTITAYTKDLKQLHGHVGKDLHEIDAEGIKAAVQALQDKHDFTAKTVSRKINSFRTFYNYLVENNHIADNPAKELQHPKIHAKPPRILSPMEYFALREVTRDNSRLHTMIELMLQTGLRIGEVSRLKIKHAYLDEVGHIHVEPYSTLDERKIPLNERAQKVLSEYLSDLKYENDEHPLFPTRDGNHIIIRNIRSAVDRAMTKAGIEEACVNDLRNTFIVHQLRHGVPIDTVAEVVGHKNKTTTQKYLELLDEDYQPTGSTKLIEL